MGVALLLSALLLASGAGHQQALPEGTVDWGRAELRVLGVGTPRVLSSTGSLTTADPYQAARRDARRRLQALLYALPVDRKRRLGDIEALSEKLKVALLDHRAGEARHFSDGTVHLPARLDFAWVPSALADSKEAVSPPEGHTGLILRLTGKTKPSLLVRVQAGELEVSAGRAGDPVGAAGVAWFDKAEAAAAWPGVGTNPRVAEAKVDKAGALVLQREDVEWLKPGVAGGLAVVLR